MESFIYFLSTSVDLCLAVQNLECFSSNPGNVPFEGLVHLLRYIRGKKNMGLNYYAKLEDAPLSDLLKMVRTNTKN